MNPIWAQMIYSSVRNVTKVCTNCKRASVYAQKPVGKFYKCPHCGHRFKEKGKKS